MKKILTSMMACACLVGFSSCDGFLDAENKTAGGQTADEYFRTPEGLASFRVYAYSSLKKIATANTIQEDGTDLFLPARGKTPSQFSQSPVPTSQGKHSLSSHASPYGDTPPHSTPTDTANY